MKKSLRSSSDISTSPVTTAEETALQDRTVKTSRHYSQKHWIFSKLDAAIIARDKRMFKDIARVSAFLVIKNGDKNCFAVFQVIILKNKPQLIYLFINKSKSYKP